MFHRVVTVSCLETYVMLRMFVEFVFSKNKVVVAVTAAVVLAASAAAAAVVIRMFLEQRIWFQKK